MAQEQLVLQRFVQYPSATRRHQPTALKNPSCRLGQTISAERLTVFALRTLAATKGTERVKVEDQIVASYDGLTVKYSGPQLNQSDLDVWETIVHLARRR